MSGIRKSFGGVPVLKGVGFELRQGEVHALMGGNGAGKSTLMKILTGVYSKDGGTIEIDGEAVEFHDTAAAEAAGVAMIFQEFSLVRTLTVAQNIFLNREPLYPRHARSSTAPRWSAARGRSSTQLGENIDPNQLVGDLDAGYAQMVEIAKALSKNARILVMDEPTASLSEHETRALFALVERLQAARHLDRLHLAPHGRDPQALRPRHGDARRPRR